ncbi:MAG: hypothetical protein JWN75_842 [Candidatus Saccharibacteria bacterium]|nr:hypothetical protein [Candidatus Saccharibacteria bacterium]
MLKRVVDKAYLLGLARSPDPSDALNKLLVTIDSKKLVNSLINDIFYYTFFNSLSERYILS